MVSDYNWALLRSVVDDVNLHRDQYIAVQAMVDSLHRTFPPGSLTPLLAVQDSLHAEAQVRTALAPINESLRVMMSGLSIPMQGFAQSQIRPLLEVSQLIARLAAPLGDTLRAFKEASPVFQPGTIVQLQQLLAERHDLAQTLRFTVLGQGAMLSLGSFEAISAAPTGPRGQRKLRSGAKSLASSFSVYVAAVDKGGSATTRQGVELVQLASSEFFGATDAVSEIVQRRDSEAGGEERLEARHEVTSRLSETVPSLLASLGEPFVRTWLGAQDALTSSSNDKTRQVFISLRTLIDEVLVRLAPDRGVKEWTTNPRDFLSDGKPTRWTRARFVLRGVSEPSLRKLVEKDLSAAVDLLNYLSRVHELSLALPDRDLDIVLMRAGGVLEFLLRSAEGR